jgi:hypothetical protein
VGMSQITTIEEVQHYWKEINIDETIFMRLANGKYKIKLR